MYYSKNPCHVYPLQPQCATWNDEAQLALFQRKILYTRMCITVTPRHVPPSSYSRLPLENEAFRILYQRYLLNAGQRWDVVPHFPPKKQISMALLIVMHWIYPPPRAPPQDAIVAKVKVKVEILGAQGGFANLPKWALLRVHNENQGKHWNYSSASGKLLWE